MLAPLSTCPYHSPRSCSSQRPHWTVQHPLPSSAVSGWGPPIPISFSVVGGSLQRQQHQHRRQQQRHQATAAAVSRSPHPAAEPCVCLPFAPIPRAEQGISGWGVGGVGGLIARALDLVELVDDFREGGAQLGVPGPAPLEQVLDVRPRVVRKVWPPVVHGGRHRRVHPPQAIEGHLVLEHLVCDHCEGIHVHAVVVRLVAEHLGRHVAVRPRLSRHCVGRLVVQVAHAQSLRKPEVPDLEPPQLGEHQVPRLEVAMDHRRVCGEGVQVGHPPRAVPQQHDRPLGSHRALVEEVDERAPLHVLGDELVRLADGARPQELHDVRVVHVLHDADLRAELSDGNLVVLAHRL
mmetsp:Transcript_595/g.1908  ORF Transcript_595/g.1908 Transcript_595/m.1908 type:complete len:349 (+) Transcript_595:654-1700(+)